MGDPTAGTRGYTLRARQESVEQTRLRITEAVMRLHERVGPRATTVSAVADEASVTRLTVYRHFPDEDALVMACATHWGRLHPRPDIATWESVADPVLRLRTALTQTYGWSRTAAPMMSRISRDVDAMPGFVATILAEDEQARVVALTPGFAPAGSASRRLPAALAHALRFSTFESLCLNGGLSDQDAVDVMIGAVLAAVGPGEPRAFV